MEDLERSDCLTCQALQEKGIPVAVELREWVMEKWGA